MPYVKQELRNQLDKHIDMVTTIIGQPANSSHIDGMVNYAISRIVHECISQKDLCYKNIARSIAAFECAKLEFYRRVAGRRENMAIETNGDIYDV